MAKTLNLEEVKDYIRKQSPESIIYLGADSERYKRNGVWWADYTVCAVVHVDGCHGAHIFGEVFTERDFDQKKNRPVMRLMTEVHKVSDLYLKLADVLIDRNVEIHLDINPKEIHASHVVVDQAVGYIRGMCNITPQLKPDAFAASFAADRLKEILALEPAGTFATL